MESTIDARACFDHNDYLILSPNKTYNFYNFKIRSDWVLTKPISVTCLAITTMEVEGHFIKDILVEAVITELVEDSQTKVKNFKILSKKFLLEQKYKDPYFFRWEKIIYPDEFDGSFVWNNYISIFVTTNVFDDKKYFLKNVRIDYYKIKESDQLCYQRTGSIMPRLKNRLKISKYLLNLIFNFIDFEDQLRLCTVNSKFKKAFGKLQKNILVQISREKKYTAKGHVFGWCDEIYASSEIVGIKQGCVKYVKFEVTSKDQGFGLTEELSWIEAGVLDSERNEISKRIKICDNSRELSKRRYYQTYTLILNYKNPDHHAFINKIVEGNTVVIWARCATTCWECHIRSFRLSMLYIIFN